MPYLIAVAVIVIVIYYSAVIFFEGNKKRYKNLTESEISNLKKKSLKNALIGFLIGIPAMFVVSLITLPLSIFLALGTSGSSDDVSFLVNTIISAPILLTPFLGAFIGWRLTKKDAALS